MDFILGVLFIMGVFIAFGALVLIVITAGVAMTRRFRTRRPNH